MIEEAHISGILGKAIYLQDQRYFQVGVKNMEAPIECYPMDLSKFLALGADFTTLSNGQITDENVKTQLNAQHEQHRALTLSISGMDRILDRECRVFAITTAEGLIEHPTIYHFVRSRLLARPAHPEADLETAIAIATEAESDAIGALYRFVLNQDRALALVYETWVRAAHEHFATYEERVKTEQVFTDLGVFADMTSALANNDLKALNSLVVTYGRMLEKSDELSRGVHLINDLKTRVTREWAPSNKRNRKRPRITPDFEDQPSTTDLSRDLIANFDNWQEKPKGKTFTADEAKEKVDHQIAAISKLIEQGNTNRADSYLRDLINFHVAHSQREHLGMSLCSLAKVAIDSQSFELAEKLVAYSLMLGINDVVIFNTQAEMFRAMGDLDQARALYQETIERFPNSVVAHTGYAEVLRAMGDFDQARALYQETIERFPNNVVTRTGYAEVLRAIGDFDQARALYQETIERFPTDVVARSGYAEVLRAMGDFDQARALYQETIERFPNSVVARNGYAEVLRAMGDFDQARALYQETIERFPNDVVARSGYAEVLRAIGDFDQARALYQDTIERFPNDVVPRSGYAEVLRAIGDFDQARALYQETIERFPKSVVARNGYAEVLRAMGDFDQARALYQETIERFPNSVVARTGYAEVLRAMGDFDQARALYQETIERFPKSVVARNGYAEVLRAIGDFDQARALYQETIERFPTDVVVRNGFANVLVLMNKFEEARSILPTEPPRSHEDWIAYHIMAMSYLREGNIDEAIRRLSYGLDEAWPSEKKYFETALAVAKIRRNEFADIPQLLPLDVIGIDFAERQTRLVLVGHSQAALGQEEEAMETINKLKTARNPQVINLAEAISRRYRLGEYSSVTLSKADINLLDSTIYDQEFRLAA